MITIKVIFYIGVVACKIDQIVAQIIILNYENNGEFTAVYLNTNVMEYVICYFEDGIL